jgi:hypothetical protein
MEANYGYSRKFEHYTRAILSILLLLVVSLVAHESPALAAKRAFVFGISDYKNVHTLQSPRYDAAVMKDRLVALGFNVTKVDDDQVDRASLNSAWGDFVESVEKNDDVVVYYSGHGVEVDGANYIVPSDVPNPSTIHTTTALRGALMRLSEMVDAITERGVNASIWILDACRDDPFAIVTGKGVGSAGGMNPVPVGNGGVFIFYAAAHKQTAIDRLASDDPSDQKVNSVFTRELVKFLTVEADKRSEGLAADVALAVIEAANHQQRPAFYDELEVPFCFLPCKQDVADSVEIKTTSADVLVPQATLAQAASAVIGKPDDKSVGNTIPAAPVAKLSYSLRTAVAHDAAEKAPTGSSAAETEKSVAGALDGNVVFLGRETAVSRCVQGKSSDNYPFGCDVLKFADTQQTSKLVEVQVEPIVSVNIRYNAPIMNNGDLQLSCVVGQLRSGDPVKFSGIVTIARSGQNGQPPDKYYYAKLEGPQRSCVAAK